MYEKNVGKSVFLEGPDDTVIIKSFIAESGQYRCEFKDKPGMSVLVRQNACVASKEKDTDFICRPIGASSGSSDKYESVSLDDLQKRRIDFEQSDIRIKLKGKNTFNRVLGLSGKTVAYVNGDDQLKTKLKNVREFGVFSSEIVDLPAKIKKERSPKPQALSKTPRVPKQVIIDREGIILIPLSSVDVDYRKSGEQVFIDVNDSDRRGMKVKYIKAGRLFWENPNDPKIYSAVQCKKIVETGLPIYKLK